MQPNISYVTFNKSELFLKLDISTLESIFSIEESNNPLIIANFSNPNLGFRVLKLFSKWFRCNPFEIQLQ